MKNDHEVLTVGVFQEVLKEFGMGIEAKIDSKIDGLRTEMRQEFVKMGNEMKQELVKVRIEIRDDIIDVIDQNIQPQITSAVSRITRLERKTA